MREIVLQIPHRHLLIFYTDQDVGWEPSAINFFIEVKPYRYQFDSIDWNLHPPTGRGYRLFVYLKEGQNPSMVRRAIKAGGYAVTKEDRDPESGRHRIWFHDPRKPTRGKEINICNVWENGGTPIKAGPPFFSQQNRRSSWSES